MIEFALATLLAVGTRPAGGDVFFEQTTVVFQDGRTTEIQGRKTIAGHECRGFRIAGASAVLELYVATDLPVGIAAFTDFLEWSGASQSMAAFMEEMRKLPGFPLETRSRVSVLGEV